MDTKSAPRERQDASTRSSSTETGVSAEDRDLEKQLQEKPMSAVAAEVDYADPREWSTKKKLLVDIVLCLWCLSLTYSSTGYVASIPALMQEFNMSRTVAIGAVSLLVLAFSAGCLVWGPASELYGRRIVYVTTGVAYSAFSIGVAFSNNAATLLVLRFFVGFFGSSSIGVIPASIGDFTTVLERGPYSLAYALMAFGGPCLGPLISSYIEVDVGPRWNLRVIAIFSTVTTMLAILCPETHGPTLAKWRLKETGRQPPKLPREQVIQTFKTAMARPWVYLFTEPIAALVSIYLAILYSILYAFFNVFSLVWIEIRGKSLKDFGLTYISLGLGFIIAFGLVAVFSGKSYKKAVEKAVAAGVKPPPEARLTVGYVGAIVAPISLFLFAWTAPFPSIHWAVPCLAELLFGLALFTLFTAFIPYTIDCYLPTAASALATGMATRAILAAAFPLCARQMFDAMTVQGATSLLGGVTLLMAPLPFMFRKYGERLRHRSTHAVK